MSVGINDRFGFGGVGAMRAYHDLYARMCHDNLGAEGNDGGTQGEGLGYRQAVGEGDGGIGYGQGAIDGDGGGGGGAGGDDQKEDALPRGLNYEQMLYWYFNHRHVRGESPGRTGKAGESRSVGPIRLTRHIPGEFWFLRLRSVGSYKSAKS